ncbi:MAG TPA: hypothetical protein VJT08_10140 [Terriglobales bacterium]|nr:hypothetical protein [Terriglobales bacterium]
MKQAWRAVFFVAALLSCMRLGAQSLPAESSSQQVPESATITIPAGTKVLMTSLAALNTVSASNESGLYLQTVLDVIEQNRVVIPAGSYVQGSVIRAVRPGRVKGRAQLQFHFDRLTLTNNQVLPISGSLASLPGGQYEMKGSGKIQPVDQIDKDAGILAGPLAGGALLGAIAGGAGGAWRGALIGGAVGQGMVLFKRGDDIHLYQGSRIEMILDRDLTIPVAKLDSQISTEKQMSSTSRH